MIGKVYSSTVQFFCTCTFLEYLHFVILNPFNLCDDLIYFAESVIILFLLAVICNMIVMRSGSTYFFLPLFLSIVSLLCTSYELGVFPEYVKPPVLC